MIQLCNLLNENFACFYCDLSIKKLKIVKMIKNRVSF